MATQQQAPARRSGSTGRARRTLGLVIAVCALAAACTSGGGSSSTAVAVEPDGSGSTGFEAKPVINLAVNDWTASALNVAVAEQLIERHLGYPVVAVGVADADEMYDDLARGSLDGVLEIWPSAMSDRQRRFFDRDQVLDLGPLGVEGKVGWFVPRYVVDADPALGSWEAYRDPALVARFATPATGANGRFLGTNPDYQQFDAEIVANLGLRLQVEFSGSEAATEAALAAAVEAEEPILVYWWTPTAAVARHDLVNVALPARTEACAQAAVADTGGVDCDYPVDELFKAASVDLALKAPDVLAFLQAFELSSEDQLGLLVAVEVDGRSIDAAATEWITANPTRWEPWVTVDQPSEQDGDG